jgi:hypothetical protein
MSPLTYVSRPELGGLDDNLTLSIISGGAPMFFRVWGWAIGTA